MKLIKVTIAALLFSFSSLLFAAVNINTATEAELASLNGVGEAKAAAIVKYRETEGLFKSVDDLANVKGIGQATVDKNRADLTVKINTSE